MKKTFRKDVHVGYEIGKDISVHNHIHNPGRWMVTIRKLDIIGVELCSKDCSEQEIASYINVVLHQHLNKINQLISEVIEFT